MKRLYKALFGVAVCVSGSCTTDTVYVVPEPGVSRLTVSPRSVEMGYADEVAFVVAVRPGATKYTWESSDPEIAYVDENDRIVPQGVGTVELTCTAGDYTQTIRTVVTSSVVKTSDYLYLEAGAESALECIRVLPETMSFTLTSDDESIVSVPASSALHIRTEAPGVATLTVRTEDGISGTLPVGVADPANTIVPAAATAFFYSGEPLGHVGYGISALALASADAAYSDGGEWTGSGTGLFLKLYNPSQSEFAAIPEGTYTHGTGENNFFAGDSYLIDAASGTKTRLEAGQFVIAENDITGYLTTEDSIVYKVRYSGARSEQPHTYPYFDITYDFDDSDFSGSSSVVIDHNGTLFYSGYGNAWRWRLNLSASEYLQLVIVSFDTDDPQGDYPVSSGFFERGTCVGMGWGTTSQLVYGGRTSNIASGQVAVKDYTYGQTITAGFTGRLGWTGDDPVSEIGESRRIPYYIDLNVEQLSFSVAEY